jgi:hypothetical protein
MRGQSYQATVPEMDLDPVRTLVDGWLRDAPQGRELDRTECAELLEAIGLPAGSTSERPVTVTVWQDPVFGPLLSGSSGGGRDAMTLLIPFDERESAALAAYVGLDHENLLRLSALVDALPEVAALRVSFGEGTAVATSGAVAPAPIHNPYLRRLRRAPVE